MKKVIYCGTEDYVQFFEKVVDTLGLACSYEVKDVDGEYEIEVDTGEDFSLVKTFDEGIERMKKAFDKAINAVKEVV